MIIFLYDNLQLKSRQAYLGIDMEFVGFAVINAKLYFFNDSKQKKKVIVPSDNIHLVFGSLYRIPNYEEVEHKLHSLHYSALPFCGYESDSDIYVLRKVKSTLIAFNSLSDLYENKFKRLKEVECDAFVCNENNKIIKHSLSKRYYRLYKSADESFIERIKEWNTTRDLKKE